MLGARWRWSQDQGFTLLELVIVTIIIGILATIAIAVFFTQREKAQRSSAISSARNVSTLAEAIRLDDTTYTDAAPAYESEGGSAFTYVNGESTGPTVVSLKTFDGDRVLIIAARGGGRCYWARQEVNAAPARGYLELDDDEACTADDQDLVDADDEGW